jgi:hypothetical protein
VLIHLKQHLCADTSARPGSLARPVTRSCRLQASANAYHRFGMASGLPENLRMTWLAKADIAAPSPTATH